MDDYRIPRYLDHSKLYPIFTLGETLAIALPALFLWVYLNNAQGLIMGVITGFILRRRLKSFKEKHGNSAIAQHRYWLLPKEVQGINAFSSSEIHKFTG